MNTVDAPWRIKKRPCPFYQQGRCVFEQSCNFVHEITVPTASATSPNRLPELLDALRDVLDPPDSISLVSEHGTSPHIPGEGWTLVNDTSQTKDSLLSPVSLPDLKLSRLSSLKNDSFDSGYASEFSSPQPLPSTLNLLASPFGSPSTRMSISGSHLFARSPFSPGFTSPQSSRNESPDLDSPSSLHPGSVATTPAEEDDDEDGDDQYSTAQWTISAATVVDSPPNLSRFSTTTLALTEESSGSESDEEAEESTAHLAYLASPTLQTFPPDENDTINTLYDVYLHSPPQPILPSDSEEDRGPIRARVFTPPPPPRKFSLRKPVPRSESCTEFPSSDSPESLAPRSISSMSNRVPVPFSFRSEGSSSSRYEMGSPESPSPSVSSKVPFGFRTEVRVASIHSIASFAPDLVDSARAAVQGAAHCPIRLLGSGGYHGVWYHSLPRLKDRLFSSRIANSHPLLPSKGSRFCDCRRCWFLANRHSHSQLMHLHLPTLINNVHTQSIQHLHLYLYHLHIQYRYPALPRMTTTHEQDTTRYDPPKQGMI
ncbi:hypothetical protein C8R45DRAFT_605038 [Mycena sanguinolenta]|nr:hypothetical protein C8R45DRAFT_605038 [Mycena sanguinolenta]